MRRHTIWHSPELIFFDDDQPLVRLDLAGLRLVEESLRIRGHQASFDLHSAVGGWMPDPLFATVTTNKKLDLGRPGTLRQSQPTTTASSRPTAINTSRVGRLKRLSYSRSQERMVSRIDVDFPDSVAISRVPGQAATRLDFQGRVALCCRLSQSELPLQAIAGAGVTIGVQNRLDQAASAADRTSRQLTGLVLSAEASYIKAYEQSNSLRN